MGAKNHGIIMPDANKNATLNQLVGAAFGAAGQRCMALPIGIFVGEAREWIPDLLAMAKVNKFYRNKNFRLTWGLQSLPILMQF